MSDDAPHRLKVVTGGGEPKPYRARSPGQPDLAVCPECNSTMTMRVKIGQFWQGGKLKGGSKATVCARCEYIHCMA